MDRWTLLETRLKIAFEDLGLKPAAELECDRVYALRDSTVPDLVKKLVGPVGPAVAERIDEYFPMTWRFLPLQPLKAHHENATILWLAWTDFATNWRPKSPGKW